MPIIGVTHEEDGRARLSRTVTTKVAIGLPPEDGSNFPKRLDHFVFLKKVMSGKEMKWVPDAELSKHYAENCREFWVVFLDDDPDTVFRTEYAAFVKRGRWCCGDGRKAQRRDLGKDGKGWGQMQPYQPCAEDGCPLINSGDCAPSGDLYFMLADFPTLGTVCRIHTSSYQSIRQIHSALLELWRVTGGRLMGVKAKLFVAPDKNVYENQNGATVSGIKWVLGLQLAARDLQEFSTKMLETAKTFQQIKGYLGGQVLDIVEEEEERGAEIAPEFYPNAKDTEPEPADPEAELRAECDRLMESHRLTRAQREQRLEQYRGRMSELLEKVRQYDAGLRQSKEGACPAKPSKSEATASPSSVAAEDGNGARSATNGRPSSSVTSPSWSEISGTPGPATQKSAPSAPPASAPTATTAPSTPASKARQGGFSF